VTVTKAEARNKSNMFLPQNSEDIEAKKKADELRKEACSQIQEWATAAIPEEIREDVFINVQEVVCNDPECAPIDTIVTILFPSGGRGMMSLPFEAVNVTQEAVLAGFPTEDVLKAWERGEEANWPPDDESVDTDLPELRFNLGQRVECRIGPDPVTGWSTGTIIELWYRDEDWPEGSYAPYKIELDDGRAIFAPGDIDQVIRAKK
jgi:hypothetical protein